jgi:hypothetical protein
MADAASIFDAGHGGAVGLPLCDFHFSECVIQITRDILRFSAGENMK